MNLTKKLKDPTQLLQTESVPNEQKAVSKAIENEIECPRCHDIMTLCSDFDNLYYVCELRLLLIHDQKIII